MRVLAITRKPHSASFEQRIASYQKLLEAQGITVTVALFPRKLEEQQALFQRSGDYDVVWWHRHLLTRYWQKKLRGSAKRIVYDYDDPVYYSSRGSGFSLTRRWRFRGMLKNADAAFAGSQYLKRLGDPFCDSVCLVPMSIESEMPQNQVRDNNITELLWLGSESTQKYLELIRPALEDLGKQRKDVRLRLVAHYTMDFGQLPVDFVQWSPESQNKALTECDIGLCPMPDTHWTRGKCPYKVLQYMASGMPWIGSAVGENVISAGDANIESLRGMCAENANEWLGALNRLIDEPEVRTEMGRNGRGYVMQRHDRQAVANQIGQLLRQVMN